MLNLSLFNPHPFIKFASFLLEVFINVFYIEIFNAFSLPIQLFVKFNKVRTVRNINAFPYTSAKNVHANRPHRNMIFADIARVDLLLLNIKLIMNKPIKHLQIVWASITEKKNIYENGYSLSSNRRYLV